MGISRVLFVFAYLMNACFCQSSYKDDYYETLPLESELPRITSNNTTVNVNIGDNIKLSCDVKDLKDFSLVWKKNGNVLYGIRGGLEGRLQVQKVIKESRMRLKQTHLHISNVQPKDTSSYTCQVVLEHDQYKARAVYHTVNVRVPPKVWPVKNDSYIVAKAGENVVLDCQTSGNPKPKIIWARRDSGPINGMMEGSAFAIYSVDRHHAGHYKCYADNGVSPIAHTDIQLVVKYPPEVETPSTVVYTGLGKSAQLYCFVYAHPDAKVEWFLHETPVNPFTLKQSYNKGLDRHTLNIPKVEESDIGTYFCNASNFYGHDYVTIELTTRPSPVTIISEEFSEYSDGYSLVWNVESSAPIIYYIVSYKNVSDNVEASVNLTIPGSRNDNSFVHTQMYNISHLQPESTYSVIVTAKNDAGENSNLEPFNFTTNSYDSVTEPVTSEQEESSQDPIVEDVSVSSRSQPGLESVPVNRGEKHSSHLVSPSGEPEEDTSSEIYTEESKPYAENKLGTSTASPPLVSAKDRRSMKVAMITAISLSAFFL